MVTDSRVALRVLMILGSIAHIAIAWDAVRFAEAHVPTDDDKTAVVARIESLQRAFPLLEQRAEKLSESTRVGVAATASERRSVGPEAIQSPFDRYAELAVRVTELESRAARYGFDVFHRFGMRSLGSYSATRPHPESPEELARAARLACWATIGYLNPGSEVCTRAIDLLQRELTNESLSPHMRLRVLKELNRLGPQERLGDERLVRTDDNRTACAGARVPEGVFPQILEIGRLRPKLRRDVLEQLRFARGSDVVRNYAIELLSDPQRYARWTAIEVLLDSPASAERDAALAAAAKQETDPALKELLLTGGRRSR